MSLLEGQCGSNVLRSAISRGRGWTSVQSRDMKVIDALETMKAADNDHT